MSGSSKWQPLIRRIGNANELEIETVILFSQVKGSAPGGTDRFDPYRHHGPEIWSGTVMPFKSGDVGLSVLQSSLWLPHGPAQGSAKTELNLPHLQTGPRFDCR
jgi:hypothetical protein